MKSEISIFKYDVHITFNIVVNLKKAIETSCQTGTVWQARLQRL